MYGHIAKYADLLFYVSCYTPSYSILLYCYSFLLYCYSFLLHRHNYPHFLPVVDGSLCIFASDLFAHLILC